jgi:hypothetical protein
MKAGQAFEILNPYDWLPPYGESAVSLATEGGDLIISISYDAEDGSVLQRNMRFQEAHSFFKASFPGPYLLSIKKEPIVKGENLGALFEYPNSDGARAWMSHFNDGRIVKHFGIVFLSENIAVEVFSKNVILGDVFREVVGS